MPCEVLTSILASRLHASLQLSVCVSASAGFRTEGKSTRFYYFTPTPLPRRLSSRIFSPTTHMNSRSLNCCCWACSESKSQRWFDFTAIRTHVPTVTRFNANQLNRLGDRVSLMNNTPNSWAAHSIGKQMAGTHVSPVSECTHKLGSSEREWSCWLQTGASEYNHVGWERGTETERSDVARFVGKTIIKHIPP